MNSARLKLDSLADIATLADLPQKRLDDIVSNKAAYYGSFFRPKKDGTQREITPPKPVLADAQHAIKVFLQKHLVKTSWIHGGVKGCSIITNAKPHQRKRMVLNLDISKFFPSTGTDRVSQALQRAGCSESAAITLAELTTYKNELPQGSPTSSILGNLVLEPLDSAIMKLCRSRGFTYTRYVDDLTISGDVDLRPYKGAFLDAIKALQYEAHPKKIRFSPRSEPQIVTGLIVNDRLRPTPDFTRDLKADIRRCWDGPSAVYAVAAEEGLTLDEFLRSLWGRVNHVKAVDPKLGRDIRGLCERMPDVATVKAAASQN